MEHLESWEIDELQKIYYYAKSKDMLIPSSKKPGLKANAYSFEEMTPIYRPLFIYLLIKIIYWMGYCILLLVGFKKYTGSTGLSYWYHEGHPADNCVYPDKD